MMQNLGITEGSEVVITNVVDVPRGIYCRLQPEDNIFLDIAAEIGPKLLMESALRRYSILSVNETILIDHGDKRFYVKVLELKPGNVVSLLGDVDLEMDFATAPCGDPRRPTSAIQKKDAKELTSEDHPQRELLHHATCENQASTGDTSALSGFGIGRRLGDGACVVISEPTAAPTIEAVVKTPAKLGSSSFQLAKQRIQANGSPNDIATYRVAARADTDSLAKDIKLAQGAFGSEGHRLGGPVVVTLPLEPHITIPVTLGDRQLDVVRVAGTSADIGACPMCLSEISQSNIALHVVRCTRNSSYHKFECLVCHEKVFKRDQQSHHHCATCNELLSSESEMVAHVDTVHAANHDCPDCSAKFTLTDLVDHRQRVCPHALELCKLCGFRMKRRDMAAHTVACSSRTEKCEVCLKYIKIVDIDTHLVACVSDRESTRPPSSNAKLPPSNNQLDESNAGAPSTVEHECVYCAKRAFTDKRQLERHVNQECLVARSFRTPMSISKSNADPATSTVKNLIQGKLKRRNDAKLLSESSSSLSFDTSFVHSRSCTGNQQETKSTIDDPLVRDIRRDRSPALTTTTTRRPKSLRHQPARAPAQLTALPVKPAHPTLPQLDAAAGLFVGNTTAAPRPTATTQSRQPTIARVSGAAKKLQAIHRP